MLEINDKKVGTFYYDAELVSLLPPVRCAP